MENCDDFSFSNIKRNLKSTNEKTLKNLYKTLSKQKEEIELRTSINISELKEFLNTAETKLLNLNSDCENIAKIADTTKNDILELCGDNREAIDQTITHVSSIIKLSLIKTKFDDIKYFDKLESLFNQYLSLQDIEKAVEIYLKMTKICDIETNEKLTNTLTQSRLKIDSLLAPIFTLSVTNKDPTNFSMIYKTYSSLNMLDDFYSYYQNMIMAKISLKLSSILTETQIPLFFDYVSELFMGEQIWVIDVIDHRKSKEIFSNCIFHFYRDIINLLVKLPNEIFAANIDATKYCDFHLVFDNHFNILITVRNLLILINFEYFYSQQAVDIWRTVLEMFNNYDEINTSFLMNWLESDKDLLSNDNNDNYVDRFQIGYSWIIEFTDTILNKLAFFKNLEAFYRVLSFTFIFLSKFTQNYKMYAEKYQESLQKHIFDVSSLWSVHKKCYVFYSMTGKFINSLKSFKDNLAKLYNDMHNPETSDIYYNIFRNNEPEIHNTIKIVYMTNREKYNTYLLEYMKYTSALPALLFNYYVDIAIKTRNICDASHNEFHPNITEIGEVLMHLPLQLEAILDEFDLEVLVALSMETIDKDEVRTNSAQWFKQTVADHAQQAVKRLNQIYSELNIPKEVQTSDKKYLEEVIKSLHCEGKVDVFLNDNK